MAMANFKATYASVLLLVWVCAPRVSAVGCRATQDSKTLDAVVTCVFGSDLRKTRKSFMLEKIRQNDPIPG